MNCPVASTSHHTLSISHGRCEKDRQADGQVEVKPDKLWITSLLPPSCVTSWIKAVELPWLIVLASFFNSTKASDESWNCETQ